MAGNYSVQTWRVDKRVFTDTSATRLGFRFFYVFDKVDHKMGVVLSAFSVVSPASGLTENHSNLSSLHEIKLIPSYVGCSICFRKKVKF